MLLIKSVAKKKSRRNDDETAFLIGCSQVFALIPGFSRSGTTITAARALKLIVKMRLSFLLFIRTCRMWSCYFTIVRFCNMDFNFNQLNCLFSWNLSSLFIRIILYIIPIKIFKETRFQTLYGLSYHSRSDCHYYDLM